LIYEWNVTTPTTFSEITLDDETSETTSFEVSGGGTVTLSLTVTDADGLTDTDEVTIIIRSQPSADNITTCYPFDRNVYPDIDITLEGFDPEGGPLQFSIVTLPSLGSLNVGIGEISGNSVIYTPPSLGGKFPPTVTFLSTFTSPPTVTFTYIVIDEQDLESNSATVTIDLCTS